MTIITSGAEKTEKTENVVVVVVVVGSADRVVSFAESVV